MPPPKGTNPNVGKGKGSRSPRQVSIYGVDKLCAEMIPERRDEFMEFARARPGAVAIQRWLKEEMGTSLTVAAIQKWVTARFLTGRQAEAFREIAKEFDNMDLPSAKDWLLGKTGLVLAEAYEKILDPATLAEISGTDLLPILTGLVREFRTLSTQMSAEQYIRDKLELELGGAQRMADLLELTFKDTQFEGILQDAIRGAMNQMEEESKRGA